MDAKGGLKTIGADGLRFGDRQRENQARLLGVNTLDPERCRGGRRRSYKSLNVIGALLSAHSGELIRWFSMGHRDHYTR